jgi:LPXTG-motif cell wall-anchored protein
MSDNQGGSLGGMIASLFRGKTNTDGTTGGFTSTHKVLSGALLAAGAAYLYKRNKNRQGILGS